MKTFIHPSDIMAARQIIVDWNKRAVSQMSQQLPLPFCTAPDPDNCGLCDLIDLIDTNDCDDNETIDALWEPADTDQFLVIKQEYHQNAWWRLIENSNTEERKWIKDDPVWQALVFDSEIKEARRAQFWDADPYFRPGGI